MNYFVVSFIFICFTNFVCTFYYIFCVLEKVNEISQKVIKFCTIMFFINVIICFIGGALYGSNLNTSLAAIIFLECLNLVISSINFGISYGLYSAKEKF